MTALIKVKVQRKAIVKLKVLPVFPADVVAEPGLIITRSGRTYTFAIDPVPLGAQLSASDLSNGVTGTGAIVLANSSTLTTNATITSTDAGASFGPYLSLNRFSASPAANDDIGAVAFGGNNSTPAGVNYAFIKAIILDPTAASEDAQLALQTTVAGTLATRATIGQGIQVGAPTGGDKGPGTGNFAGTLYVNNDAVLLSASIGTTVQAFDADLSALAANSTDGLWAHTGAGTGAARTLAAATGLAWTNPAGIAGNPSIAYDIPSLTNKASPHATNDYIIIYDAAGTATKKTPVGAVSGAGGVTSVNGQTGALTIPTMPGGRLTLTTGTPVMSSDVAGATTDYYTPTLHQILDLWDGTNWVPTDLGGELSQATTDTTKSPAAVANSSNYDKFVWDDSGTKRCTRGPAWSSDTSRGTGAGTTELELFQGRYVNKVAITNGPAARRGRFVGMIRSNGSAAIDWKLGSAAAGGGEARLCVWNAFNRRRVVARVTDTNVSSSYSSATVRSADGSATNRVSFISGLQEEAINAVYYSRVGLPAVLTSSAYIGLALDSTSVFDKKSVLINPAAATFSTGLEKSHGYTPQGGFHFVQALEAADGTNSATFVYNTDEQALEFVGMM